jgi:CRP-like cAMP-binding protein
MALAVLRYALDVDITPLLATSAILTAVVGLALQGVLGNLLSGVSLSLVRSIDVGNLIRVGEIEGIVVRTNWRETILRTRDLDYVHVPNNVLASETFTNFSKPSMLHRHTLEVGASYSDPPANVIAALEEAAREASSTLERPAPVAHVTAYLDFGINYKLFFFSENYWSKLTVEGEVARLVWYKFKRRGIEIPFPMSDQLLNDFMAVVYNQRRIPPSGTDVDRMLAILSDSEFLVRPTEDPERRESIVSEPSLRELAARCRLVRFTNGEWLCRQGDAGSNCWVVVDGAIDGSIASRDGGPEITFRTEPGSVFGEMSLFTGMTRAATGTFSQETELLEIPREAFAQLLASEERVMEEIAELVAARNRANADFLEKAAAMPREQIEESCDSSRVLARLKSLASWGKRLVAGP